MTRSQHGGVDNRFLEIVAPICATELLGSYWESQPLIIPGAPEKFDRLHFDFERFAGALEHMPPGSVRASTVSPGGEGRYLSIEGSQARHCFDSGMTICVDGIDRQSQELAALARDTKQALSLAGVVCCNCYLSPEDAGFGLHFDKQSVFLLQVEGSKHWRFAARPAVEFPPEAIDALPRQRVHDFRMRHPRAPLSEPGEADWLEHTLHPGDVLYLPPGTWHRGRAGQYSLAVTLTCCTCDFSSCFATLLQHRLFPELAWRRNLPAALDDGPVNGLPVPVESFIADRLAELREFVAALRPGDFATAWRSQVTGRPEP